MKEVDTIELLKSYSVCKKFVQAQEYAKTYFDPTGTQKIAKKEQYEARMHVIESLIQLLEPSDEYTLLHLHYINGVPIDVVCRMYVYITQYRISNVKQGA